MSQSASSSQTNSLSSDESGESEPVAADYRTKEILSKIKSVLENSFQCDFDDLLRHFMSMCLNGKDGKKFEERQTIIERIQDKYNSEYTDNDTQQSASNTQDNFTISLDKESELIAYRDEFLDGIFQRCLQMVLVIANDSTVKTSLENFSMSRSHPTPEGHKTYAALCNYVLDLLKDLKGLPLCKAAGLDLRVSCANPYKHHGEALEFVRTSRHAAVSVRSSSTDTSTNASFGEAPETGFLWSQMLSCDKVISFKPHISAEAATVLQPGARFGVKRKVVTLYDQYGYGATEPLYEHPVASSSTYPRAKRVHSNSDDDPPSNKRPRQNSASKDYILPVPFVQQAIPIVKDEAPQVHPLDKAEVHSVAYAMEMLSYGVGVSHVINTVIAGALCLHS
ncbi:hypothetical protein HYPSUDRAFT_1083044 [Hypholoma sublateritium FD-334 SS-4]|uniref:Uncharacterized protein n=1 Tax=Hypholoma sublateritium (strain FD-334 SS-4) TaxID=945553 RepID=A0A0D2PKJ7_HYPSF|nr:hypothetical protein HYPSUDRAFT_1083044 [Hypholoma sublateritium FD-334 SS-4]